MPRSCAPAGARTRGRSLPGTVSATLGRRPDGPQRHNRGVQNDELGHSIRAWRDRLDPTEAGLSAGARRRAPGLRREELAGLAGVSVDYLSRLEQGRATNPSEPVLASLARALRLPEEERCHLYLVAGAAPPGTCNIDRHITPGVQRMLDRLEEMAGVVYDAPWG